MKTVKQLLVSLKPFSCKLAFLPLCLLALMPYGCATVKFYSDPQLKAESGLRVYSPKPYLMVEYGGTRMTNLKATVVYLPDLSNPQFIRIKPGIGSASLKLELKDGMLTAYGQTADTKIPETLGKVTDLLTKSTASVNDVIRSKTEAEPGEPAVELYEIIMENGQTRLNRVK